MENSMDHIEVLPAVISKPTLFKKLRALLLEARTTFRKDGFKGVWRRYGWKIFAVFFVYYLIRDLFLYVFLPWFIIKNFNS